MALDTYAGSFQLDTGVLTDSGDTQAITGVGFTPKVVFFWNCRFEEDLTSTDGHSGGVGFSDGTNERAISWSAGAGDIDGVPAAFSRRLNGPYASISNLGGGSVDWKISIDSMDADGFTIIIPPAVPGQSGNAEPASDDFVYFLALGGDDIEDVAIGSFDSIGTVGRQEVESIGITGIPDFLMLMASDTAAGTDEDLNEDGDGGEDLCFSLGMATKLNQVCVGMRAESEVTTSLTFDTLREEILSVFDNSTSTLLQSGTLVSLNDDGFSLRWTRAAERRVFYLALKGPKVKVGVGTTPEVPTKRPIPGLGLTPKAVLGLSTSLTPSLPSLISGLGFSFGGGTTDFQRLIAGNSATARVPQQDRRFIEDATVRIHSTSGQIRALGRIFEFGNNDLTLDWVISDPPSIKFAYVAFGDTDPAATAPQIFDNVARLNQIGHELDTPLFVTNIVWAGATAPGHRVVFGESDTLGDSSNEVLRLSSNPASATVVVSLNAQFLNGLQLTQIDSGTVFVYLQAFSITPVHALITVAGDTTLIAAPGVGLSLYVTHVFCSLDDGGDNTVGVREGPAGTFIWRTFVNGAGDAREQIRFDPPWKLPTNTALVANHADNNPDVFWTIQYFVAPT